MKRVYIAGSYDADNVMQVLYNMRNGMRKSVEVLLAGFAVFSPWLDHHFVFMLCENEQLDVETLREHSMAWLRVSDAVLVLPNSEHSKGTQAEIALARVRNIPVYYDLTQLKKEV